MKECEKQLRDRTWSVAPVKWFVIKIEGGVEQSRLGCRDGEPIHILQ